MRKRLPTVLVLMLFVISISTAYLEAETTILDSNNSTLPILDTMITEFPHFEGFEDTAIYEMPLNWSTSLSHNSSVYLNIIVFDHTPYEGNKALNLFSEYCYSSVEHMLIAITPPIDNLQNRRVRFMAYGSRGSMPLIIGTAMNNSGDIQFTPHKTIYITSTYEQYQHNFGLANEDDQFIALKYTGPPYGLASIYIDNFFIETIPTGSELVITQENVDFGVVYSNRSGSACLNVENWGSQPLEINFSQTGTELSFFPEELTINPFGSGHAMVHLNPEFQEEGAYSGSFIINSNDPLQPEVTFTTTATILPELPEGIAKIGTGDINMSLPFSLSRLHSYSQTIYHAGEIGIENQSIERISWHYNGHSAWGPDEFKIYLGLTDEYHFGGTIGWGNVSWIDIAEMTKVYDGTITLPAIDGLVEIVLDVPFDYDNSKNLVVGVLHQASSWPAPFSRFYGTEANEARSISYTSDSMVAPNPAYPPAPKYMSYGYPNVILQFGEISDSTYNEDVEIIPSTNLLSQNYPNPFNPETVIDFTIRQAGKVTLEIYNMRGQKVMILLNEHKEAGMHNVIWKGTDDNGKTVSSGVYFYNIRSGGFTATQKMILMK